MEHERYAVCVVWMRVVSAAAVLWVGVTFKGGAQDLVFESVGLGLALTRLDTVTRDDRNNTSFVGHASVNSQAA